MQTTQSTNEINPIVIDIEQLAANVLTISAHAAETAADEQKSQSIYDYLVDQRMVVRLVAISLHQADVPFGLRADASQEIKLAWSQAKLKPGMQFSQVCNYATMIGHQRALKLRRQLGAVVYIPGQAWWRQSGRDSDFMKSIGCATNPFNIDECLNSLEPVAPEPDDLNTYASTRLINGRMDDLIAAGVKVTPLMRQAVTLIAGQGMTYKEAAEQMGYTEATIKRSMAAATNLLHDLDSQQLH